MRFEGEDMISGQVSLAWISLLLAMVSPASSQIQKTRLAWVGFELDGSWTFMKQAQAEPNAEVVAVADPHPELLERAKLQAGANARAYSDYVKMLDEVKPDAVCATLPNIQHLPLLRECAKRRIHVWFQKPIATSAKDAREMERLAEQSGIRLMINYVNLWSPPAQGMAAKIKSGDLGPLQRIVTQSGYGVSHEARLSKYYLGSFWDLSGEGGGSLMEQATYGINWTLWLLGRPDSVYAVARKLREDAPFAAEDDAWVIMNYPHATAMHIGSWSLPDTIAESGGSWQLFVGAKGALHNVLNKVYLSAPSEQGGEPPEPRLLELPEVPPEHRNGIAHFVYCLRNSKPFDEPHTPHLSVWVAEVVDAAYESIRTGRAVYLSK
jgi:predicted dehydrogenase